MGTLTQRRAQRLLEEVGRAISFDHPRLTVEARQGKIIVQGVMSVTPTVDEFAGSGAIASYDVRLEIPSSYPASEPKVFELGGAFPHTPEFHCNPDGDCCVCVFETWRATAKDVSISAYLNGPLRNFLLSQYIRKETGKWPFDEWGHGLQGYIDACAERLGCRGDLKDVEYLLQVLSHRWPRGHWLCPCGSGKKIRDCCRTQLEALAEDVGVSEARAMRRRLLQLRQRGKSPR